MVGPKAGGSSNIENETRMSAGEVLGSSRSGTVMPATQIAGPRLKIRMKKATSQTNRSFMDGFYTKEHQEESEKVELSRIPALTDRGRPKRAVRAPHQPDMVYGSDIPIPSSDIVKGNEENELFASSPPRTYPHILSIQPRSSPCHTFINQASGTTKADLKFWEPNVSEPDIISSTVPASNDRLFTVKISADVYAVLSRLRSTTEIQINLPPFLEDNAVHPYTAASLTQLYLLCYEWDLVNLCDLITDTWIRAFHAVRARTSQTQVWRPNPSLEQRTRHVRTRRNAGISGTLPWENGPKYDLPVPHDPAIADEVIYAINPTLLNMLFKHTRTDCGARLFWADTLVLGGNAVEGVFTSLKQNGAYINEDLVFEVACTGLRMCRRKLTLKCEESVEGAWCKRYHEHSRKGAKCYRELAAEQRQRRDNGARDEDDLEQAVLRLLDAEEMDVDAKGDSEEE